jgi:hypothetical protein
MRSGKFCKTKDSGADFNKKSRMILIGIRPFQVFLGQYEFSRVIRDEERLYLKVEDVLFNKILDNMDFMD